jgi:hypothetical protein
VASEIAPAQTTAPAETGTAPLKKLKINWWDFEAALEGFAGITGDISHFLDKETGAVITLFPDLDEEKELRERIEAASANAMWRSNRPTRMRAFDSWKISLHPWPTPR